MDLRRSDVEGGLVTLASIPRIQSFIRSFDRLSHAVAQAIVLH